MQVRIQGYIPSFLFLEVTQGAPLHFKLRDPQVKWAVQQWFERDANALTVCIHTLILITFSFHTFSLTQFIILLAFFPHSFLPLNLQLYGAHVVHHLMLLLCTCLILSATTITNVEVGALHQMVSLCASRILYRYSKKYDTFQSSCRLYTNWH